MKGSYKYYQHTITLEHHVRQRLDFGCGLVHAARFTQVFEHISSCIYTIGSLLAGLLLPVNLQGWIREIAPRKMLREPSNKRDLTPGDILSKFNRH